MMNADHTANTIIASIKKSNLNFYIQETPFSIFINLRKSFIKKKGGNIPYSVSHTSDTNTDTIEQKVMVENLKQEKSDLEDSNGKLEAELNERRDAFYQLNVELEKANLEQKNLEHENKVLKKKFEVKSDTFKSEKATAETNI